MFNHARTLLLNTNGSAGFLSGVGEELIPPGFVPVNLPGTLLSVRQVLFGGSPDKAMLNYRGRQYLALLHTPDLEEFVTDLDSRITYNFVDNPYFAADVFQASVNQVAGPTNTLSLQGTRGAPDANGQMEKVWDVLVVDGATVSITLRKPRIAAIESYTLTSGLSNAFPLIGDNFSAKIGSGIGAQWTVSSLVRPISDLGSVLASIDTLGDEVTNTLFARNKSTAAVEPYITFYRLWKDHYSLAHRLGGAILALIYQTEELR